MSSIPNCVHRNNLKLVFVASLLRMQHLKSKKKDLIDSESGKCV